ncbi:MAG: Ig-like domain repeat protein [Armatimonadetes bacterium]|nr:Ig-like domain repeat protein [Armatimonadota bacterium]
MKRIMVLRAVFCGVFMGMLLGVFTPAQAQVGKVWAWGDNYYGQLGDGTNTSKSSPAQVPGLSGVLQLVGGGGFSLVLKLDGTVWAWGDNYYGQLGDGTNTSRSTPVRVSGLTNVVQVAVSAAHSLAIKSDGTVWAWGDNTSGEVGDGTGGDGTDNFNRNTPVQISGLTGAVQVAGGWGHSLALKSNGTVWAWGANSNGQLGDGTTTNRNVPVQVSNSHLTGVVQIAGGGIHSLALTSDGLVLAWGDNTYGQIGDGTFGERHTPTYVSGYTYLQIAGGGGHSLALKSDGSMWTWGRNDSGQLGDGSNRNKSGPLQVAGLTGVVHLAGGGVHSLAVQSNGSVWTWGNNTNGQLGDGTNITKYTPVQTVTLKGQNLLSSGYGHSLSLQSFVLATTISPSNLTLGYGVPITLSATIKNAMGGLLLNTPLTFALDGVALGTTNTDAAGTAHIAVPNPLALTIGKHTFTVTFAGDRLYKAYKKTGSLTITKAVTSITVKTVTGRPGDTKPLTATLKRNYDNSPLSSIPLTFKIDGNAIGTATTDGTGTATLSYKFDETYPVGSHILTAEYTGDDAYKAYTGKGTLKVAKATTKLLASSASGKAGATVTLKAKLTRKSDSAFLTGKTIRFKIDDTEVGSVATDGNGLAALSYTIPNTWGAGLHLITALFDGDAFYLNVGDDSKTLTVK